MFEVDAAEYDALSKSPISDPRRFSECAFCEAAALWQRLRKLKNLRPRTHEAVKYHIAALNVIFGTLQLKEITGAHLREYQIARRANALNVARKTPEGEVDTVVLRPWKRVAGASLVNHEVCVLQQVLQLAGEWPRLAAYYQPLAVSQWSPRTSLSVEEEQKLFECTAGNPRAELARLVAIITNNTGAAGCELRGLQLRHVHLREGGDVSEIQIPREATKNYVRPRVLPLNDTARAAFEACLQRAYRLGSCRPEHYLFPFRMARNQFDPERPASRSWLRKSWDELRKASGVTDVRPHDMRHQVATRMFENGQDPETVQAIMGHGNVRMTRKYVHHRKEIKLAALRAVESTAKPTFVRRPSQGQGYDEVYADSWAV